MDPDTEEAIQRRTEFYTSDIVDNFIRKYGVPKTRIAMQNLVALSCDRSDADDGLTDLMSYVYFQVHSQQVNIRDKANGKLIVSIKK